jgi:hypothetical protein
LPLPAALPGLFRRLEGQARNASGMSELVSQRSRCNSAWHSWQHTHGPLKFSTPVFSADNTSAFVKISQSRLQFGSMSKEIGADWLLFALDLPALIGRYAK